MKSLDLENKIHNILVYILCDNPISKKYRLNKFERYLIPIGFEKIKELVNNQSEYKERMLTDTKEKSLNKELENFLNVLKNNFKEEDLHNFYYNIEWVKLKVKKFKIADIIFDKITYGTYDTKINKLYLFRNISVDNIYHELFHLSSRDTTRKDDSDGFVLDLGNEEIGNALNEGYTELLATRYFGKSNGEPDCYFLETKVAKNLEMIVGREKMQSLYLNADFFGLFNELEKYYTKEEIENFIISLDVVSLHREKKYVGEEEIKKIDLIMEDIICFLTKGFCKVLLAQNNNVEANKALLIPYLQELNIRFDKYDEYEFNIDKINQVIISILGPQTKLDECILKKEETCYNK